MKHLLLSAAMACVGLTASAWGQKGHDTVAYIAENHLTEATAAALDSLLDGRSPVYWANWLDNASHTPAYAYTKTWHYKNVDADRTYDDMPANPAGDAIVAIKQQIETLSKPDVSKADAQLALKILIHVVGDMHQPMHMGHATDLGGNRVKIKYFNRDKNLHGVWDTDLVESAHKWSYSEWQQQLDRLSPEQEALVVQGDVDDWGRETIAITRDVYNFFQPGLNISYNQIAYWTPTIEQQLLRGGLRLAHVLNSIYDPSYAPAYPAK
ncbi:MAG: S1/P1 nuclease [Muribaculaceae bacterium]|nr:S1/P1 nuclease [Muribaculaceae bacterium]MDE6541494.1 S1/P1 nuclease [Muribaculaceae bacterium]